MSMNGAYSASLGGFQSGALASTAPTENSQNHNVSVGHSALSVVHLAVAVIVVAVILLAIGRGYLRNARIA